MSEGQQKGDLSARVTELEAELERLRQENGRLKRGEGEIVFGGGEPNEMAVSVPDQFKGLFQVAQDYVSQYFRGIETNPFEGRLAIDGEKRCRRA